jgi:hypothetical protein
MKLTGKWMTGMGLLILGVLLIAATGFCWPVPDTGQTKCYDNTGEIPCPSEGEAFYGQGAQYTIHPMSFTKLAHGGTELPDTATVADGWIMTRDNVTGLIWEVKQDKDDAKNYDNPHDADNTYTWYDSDPATNSGNAGTAGNGTDTEDFINALNAENYGGYNNWRLPDRNELQSIVDYDRINPSIDTTFFPNTIVSLYSNTLAGFYWSSTTGPNYMDAAWVVSFNYGYYNSRMKHAILYLRAVRVGQ